MTVTRFYAPLHIYQLLRKIHEFDTALREAFLKGAHEHGVYFIRRDFADRLIPCSPNKLMFSKLTSVRPGNRLLPVNFQTVAKSVGHKNLEQLDRMIQTLLGHNGDGQAMIAIETAVKLIELAYENLEFSNPDDDEQQAHIALIEHLSKSSEDTATRGSVLLIVARNRENQRIRQGGRFTDNPDTKQQQEARESAETAPALLMLRENGTHGQGWRGLPFWWPILVVPRRAVSSVFAADSPADDALATPPGAIA